jgi:hypothetical protein
MEPNMKEAFLFAAVFITLFKVNEIEIRMDPNASELIKKHVKLVGLIYTVGLLFVVWVAVKLIDLVATHF